MASQRRIMGTNGGRGNIPLLDRRENIVASAATAIAAARILFFIRAERYAGWGDVSMANRTNCKTVTGGLTPASAKNVTEVRQLSRFARARARYAESTHLVEQSGALHSKARGSAVFAPNHPIRASQCSEDNASLGLRKGANLPGGIFDAVL